MTARKKRADSASRRSRKRREEQQLELDLPASDARFTSATPDLTGKRRAEAMSDPQRETRSEMQSKRLRNGVLVQQFLR